MEITEIHKIFLASSGICTDSRKIKKNSVFIALKGENFNGNLFAANAIKKGCLCAIVDEKEYCTSKKIILVNNCLTTLQELALFHRKKNNIPVIAITGTNGKTTTKELITRVLGKKYQIHANKGNLNNHIGVPLTLLSITKKTEICIVEMGANHIGEINHLCQIAQPTLGLITNIGHAHIEGFGSLEGVIKAKKELFDFLIENDGILFVNKDNIHVRELVPGKCDFSYGISKDNSIFGIINSIDPFLSISWGTNIKQNINNTTNKKAIRNINTQLVGSYNFENVLSAICIGKYYMICDKDIKDSIEGYIPENNRSQLFVSKRNTILLDAYNANPSSMKAALENFSDMKAAHKVIILGDMLELGKTSIEEHLKIVKYLSDKKFQKIYLVGSIFSGLDLPKKISSFKSTTELKKHLGNNTIDSSTILLKASRRIGLEDLVSLL